MLAAEKGYVSCLELLIRHGADKEAKDNVSSSIYNISGLYPKVHEMTYAYNIISMA